MFSCFTGCSSAHEERVNYKIIGQPITWTTPKPRGSVPMLAFVGLDGAGKTTIIRTLQRGPSADTSQKGATAATAGGSSASSTQPPPPPSTRTAQGCVITLYPPPATAAGQQGATAAASSPQDAPQNPQNQQQQQQQQQQPPPGGGDIQLACKSQGGSTLGGVRQGAGDRPGAQSLAAIDVPGAQKLRHGWLQALNVADGLVVVVSCVDRFRYAALREHLWVMMSHLVGRNVPCLFFASKHDLAALPSGSQPTSEQLILDLDLAALMASLPAPWTLKPVRSGSYTDVAEGLAWLVGQVEQIRALRRSPMAGQIFAAFASANAAYSDELLERKAELMLTNGGTFMGGGGGFGGDACASGRGSAGGGGGGSTGAALRVMSSRDRIEAAAAAAIAAVDGGWDDGRSDGAPLSAMASLAEI